MANTAAVSIFSASTVHHHTAEIRQSKSTQALEAAIADLALVFEVFDDMENPTSVRLGQVDSSDEIVEDVGAPLKSKAEHAAALDAFVRCIDEKIEIARDWDVPEGAEKLEALKQEVKSTFAAENGHLDFLVGKKTGAHWDVDFSVLAQEQDDGSVRYIVLESAYEN